MLHVSNIQSTYVVWFTESAKEWLLTGTCGRGKGTSGFIVRYFEMLPINILSCVKWLKWKRIYLYWCHNKYDAPLAQKLFWSGCLWDSDDAEKNCLTK